MEDQGHQFLELLHRQGNIRFARLIELALADLNDPEKSMRFFEAAMSQFDEQGRSHPTVMSHVSPWLTCETNKRISKFLDIVSSHADCMDVVHEYVDYSGMRIMVHGDLFPLQGCNVAANKHPLKDLGQVIIVTPRSAEVADKKAEGGHTEQANWDRVRILKLVPTKLSEVTSKNETKLDKTMVDGTRIDCSPANSKFLQPEDIKAVSESGFKMDDSTKDDKMLSKLESHAGGNVEAKAKEAGTVFIFMEPTNTAACTNLASICRDKLIKILSSCTKFAIRAMKEVARISKTGFVMLLIISNPTPIVSAVGTYNSTAVTSPIAPQTLNNTPPPPMPPSPVPKRRIRRMGPLSSNLTESKEWGLPPKKSPPSCLPAC